MANTKITHDSYYAAIEAVSAELGAQTDRGAAIVGVALLDEKLRLAIEVVLDPSLRPADRRDLFEGPSAPLPTYSARARMARALGLFGDDLLADLKLLGRIRNRFAQRLNVRAFSDPRIAPLCEQLRSRIGPRALLPDGILATGIEYHGPADARRAFLVAIGSAVRFVFLMLSYKGHTADSPVILSSDPDAGV